MSIRRRRSQILKETIADSFETNSQIEQRLDQLPEEMRSYVLDALDVLKSAGENGLFLADWASQLRQIYGEDMPMSEILKTTVKNFPIVVKKLAPKHYAWSVVGSFSGDDDEDTNLKAVIGSHVDLTSRAFEIMNQLGVFTIKDLKNRLPSAFVDNLMSQFSGMLIKTGDRYRLKQEEPTTRSGTMQGFRDIVANASKNNLDPDDYD